MTVIPSPPPPTPSGYGHYPSVKTRQDFLRLLLSLFRSLFKGKPESSLGLLARQKEVKNYSLNTFSAPSVGSGTLVYEPYLCTNLS